MYIVARIVPNKKMAQMWRELFEAGGVPAMAWPHPQERQRGEAARYVVLVPLGKDHVAEEALRNT
ncbi:MAG: hypothetical protein RMM58_00430 [Chloroflexota bacterium]|nr:hypothetical protein [Dehalococcoidia bacterium]MDW8252325.1 hypothetical protein [Chloroflexota bacterium]